jgi:ABC transporter DrrB family efflux protein
VRSWLGDVVVLTRRNVVHIAREPFQISDVTVQPILFTLLFVTLFNAAMVIPGGGSYKAFAIGGMVTMNLTMSGVGTAVAMASDLSKGVMSRFRTLPMSRSAVLAGRTVTDVMASVVCGSIVVLTGLAIGWRPGSGHGLGDVAAGLGVAVVFSYAVSWMTACLGLAVKDPESAQAVGLMALFLPAFASSCFVPTQGLPHWLRVIADWNPVSAVASSCRELFGNPNPARLNHGFEAQHPVLLALIWSAAIVTVCAPLATHLLRLRTTD